MGGKPKKKPLTFDDLVSGFDRITTPLEFWEVHRRLHPGHRAKEFKMGITKGSYQRITRGRNKGGHRMTLVVEYIDDIDEGYQP